MVVGKKKNSQGKKKSKVLLNVLIRPELYSDSAWPVCLWTLGGQLPRCT